MREAFLLLLLLLSCKGSDAQPQGGFGKGGKGGGKGAVFAVDVMEVVSQQVDYIVQAPGTLDAFERVQVTARVAGVVDKVGFAEGQLVKKGAVLVVIESERYQLAVNSAKAVVDKANASLADALAQVARREKAIEEHPGLIPGEELSTYKTKAAVAKADAAAAEQTLHVAQINLRDAYVRAPIDGVMQTRTVETGQYVNAGYLMATLLRDDPMLLRFQVEPKDAPRLKPGMIATFTLRETQRTYSAKINLVAAAAEAATRTVGVTAEVIAEGGKYWLRPGSFCDVLVNIGGSRPAPVIPRAAARATDKGYIVWVVENDAAVSKPVTLGMNTKDARVEVRSGLKDGDLLVIKGAEALSEGAKVKTVKNKAPASSSSVVPLDIPVPSPSTSTSGSASAK
jgi:membrane fusion protein, multidrug efflux system